MTAEKASPAAGRTKKKRRKAPALPLWLCTAGGLLFFLLRPAESGAAVREGLRLCYESVIPALFPYFILSSLIISSGLGEAAGRLCERPFRFLFGLPGACAPAFALGLLSGFPVGARAARELYERGVCTRDECERLLAFCNNTGPGFLLGTVGAGFFGSARAGLLLYLCHALSAVLTGVLLRPRRREGMRGRPAGSGAPRGELPAAASLFTEAVRSAALSLFYVVAFITAFAALLRMLESAGIFSLPAALFSRLTALPETGALALLRGVLEVTAGCAALGDASLPYLFRLTAASALCGWAGLCVHAQVLCVLEGSGLSAKRYLFGKALQGVLAALLTLAAGAAVSPALAAMAVSAAGPPADAALALPAAALLHTVRSLCVLAGAALLARRWERRRSIRSARRQSRTD